MSIEEIVKAFSMWCEKSRGGQAQMSDEEVAKMTPGEYGVAAANYLLELNREARGVE